MSEEQARYEHSVLRKLLNDSNAKMELTKDQDALLQSASNTLDLLADNMLHTNKLCFAASSILNRENLPPRKKLYKLIGKCVSVHEARQTAIKVFKMVIEMKFLLAREFQQLGYMLRLIARIR